MIFTGNPRNRSKSVNTIFPNFTLYDLPVVLGHRLSEAKPADEGSCTPLLTAKYEPDTIKTDRDNDVTKWWFSIFGEKCQVCDVTLGGGRVVFTSGFLFPIGLDLCCLNCRWDLVGNYYFRFGERRKIAKINFGAIFWQFFLVILAAMPDVHGRQLSEAKLAEEGRCVPLLTRKYEPLPVGSDRVISGWTWRFSVFRISGVLGKPFFLKKSPITFFLILYIASALVDVHYFVFIICPHSAGFLLHVIEKKYVYLAFYGSWRAIPDVLDRRRRKRSVSPYWPPNMNRIRLNLTEITRSQIVCIVHNICEKHVFSRFGGVWDPQAIRIWL